MAFTATNSTKEPRAQSIGPKKIQLLTWTATSGTTSGTVTASNLIRAEHIIIDGVSLTAAPTFSGNVTTLAFVDPAATVFGTCMVIGV